MNHHTGMTGDIRIHSYLQLMGLVLLYWDHLITFGSEIRYIWNREKTQSVWWFLLNRYLAFFGNIPVLAMIFITLSRDSCLSFVTYHQLTIIANALLVSGLLTFRVYAIYSCDARIIWILVPIGFLLVALAGWSMLGQVQVPSTSAFTSGCHTAMPHDTAIRLASAWEALFFYDTMIIGFTLYKAFKWRNITITSTEEEKLTLPQLLLRDGGVYFVIMALANLANIVTFFTAPPHLRGCLSTFASSIQVAMISRLMINLQAWADYGIPGHGSTKSLTQLDTMEFMNVDLEEENEKKTVLPVHLV